MIPIYEDNFSTNCCSGAGITCCCREYGIVYSIYPDKFYDFVIKHIIQNFPEGHHMNVKWDLYFIQFMFKKEGNYFEIILRNAYDKLAACKILFGKGYFDNYHSGSSLEFHSDLDEIVFRQKYLEKNGDLKIKKLNANQLQNFILHKEIIPAIVIKRRLDLMEHALCVDTESNKRSNTSVIGYFSSSLQCDEKMVWVIDNVFTLLDTPVVHDTVQVPSQTNSYRRKPYSGWHYRRWTKRNSFH